MQKTYLVKSLRNGVSKMHQIKGESKTELKARLDEKYEKCTFEVFGPVPSIKTLERYSMDSICPALDGCRVEPDGTCQHGYPSWLLALGYI